MKRLIDADALIEKYGNWYVKDTEEHTQWGFVGSLRTFLKEQPTVDAVPSETLYDFIKELGSITYGKERFFRQDNGTWYDREHADYITLDDVIRRIVNAVRELDDSELFQRELWDRECEDD